MELMEKYRKKLQALNNEIRCETTSNTSRNISSADDRNILKTILHMPMSEFRKCGFLVRVRCGHLDGEDIFIASTEKEAQVGRSEGLVVYTGDELIELVKGRPIPDIMRQIHDCKKILQGTLIEAKENG